jgi:hypothetical protein
MQIRPEFSGSGPAGAQVALCSSCWNSERRSPGQDVIIIIFLARLYLIRHLQQLNLSAMLADFNQNASLKAVPHLPFRSYIQLLLT